MMKKLLIIPVLSLLMIGCDDTSESKTSKKLTSKELKQEAYDEIMAMENSMMAVQNKVLDTMKATKLSRLYYTYALNNLKDSVSQEFLFKAGELRMGVGQYNKSIEIFEQLNRSYPNQDKIVETKYLIAFIYHTYLQNLGIAESKYQEVIDKHPDHNLAQDARVAIKTLNMSDEELIEMFEKKNGV